MNKISEARVKIRPRLRDLLNDQEMTQKELSLLTGIAPSILSRFDDQKSHKDEHLFLIAEALGRTVEELFKIEKGAS
ncbi:helix-turn-helix transcriptional regulator [Sporolactobacillus sp. STCC-11]|uniref:helix-turn-helix domain-containing protein n=1 Tax=Sporolactobacillus caesalpiniae TaxID=3230362 RepID=UPI0033921C4C